MSKTLAQRAAKLSQQEIVKLLSAYETITTTHQALQTSYNTLQISHNTLAEQRATLTKENGVLATENAQIKRQLDWFKRQLFGRKSERRIEQNPYQLSLDELLTQEAPLPEVTETVTAYQRRIHKKHRNGDEVTDQGLRFSDDVPVEVIRIANPDIQGLHEDDYEVIAEKVSYKLAQRPGSYVVLKYVREVVKRKADQMLSCPAMPAGVLEKSLADVSFQAGILVDKFVYHLPLYRQHQRLLAAGITLSRGSLTHISARSIALLETIYYAQLSSIVSSEVIAMDETPIKAGRQQGKMKTGYFWPVYGDTDEMAFVYSPSHATHVVCEVLQEYSGVLLSDGYAAYDRYAAINEQVTHAQCWSHTRRVFLAAEALEPTLTAKALAYIRSLYEHEQTIRQKHFKAEQKRCYRIDNSRPIVDAFFQWLRQTLNDHGLKPTNPFTEAAHYALKRQMQLSVFLTHPGVAMDTNHLERGLRVIPMGRKNWQFCWTELGAHQVGIIQSLLTTCKLHNIDPYTYLVDVLQRIDQHPASDVHLLTPRLWKQHFADNPLRSALDRMISQ